MEMFALVSFLPFLPSLSAGHFQLMSQIISLSSQLCLGKFKSGQNHLQVKKGKNNSACTGIQCHILHLAWFISLGVNIYKY